MVGLIKKGLLVVTNTGFYIDSSEDYYESAAIPNQFIMRK